MSHFITTLGDGAVWIELEESFYPRAALYGAAYVFIDRCYVHLDRLAAGRVRVELRLKGSSSAPESGALEAMAGELQNELLGQAWRHQIVEQNRALIEAVATRALGGATGPGASAEIEGTLDDLLAAGDATFDDPLGIAMSWEQKYAKKDATPVEPSSGQGGRS